MNIFEQLFKLKQYYWAHFFAFSSTIIIFLFYKNNFHLPTNFLDTFLYLVIYIVILLTTLLIAIYEYSIHKKKITNKFLLYNETYNILWHLYFYSGIANIFIIITLIF